MKSFYLQSDIVVETSRCTRWWTRWPRTSRTSSRSRIKGQSWWLCWRWCKKSMFERWWMARWGGGQAGEQGGGLGHQVVTKRYPTWVSSKLCEFFSSPWASLNHCYVIPKDNMKVLGVVVRKTRIYAASFPITMIYARYNKHRPSSKCSCPHFHHNKHINPVFNSCFRSNP